jgi:hypothetical protein
MSERNHMGLVPIVLFVFNRPWHTKQTIETLKKNSLAIESNLFFYSDGPKTVADEPKVKEVRDYINTLNGFKKIQITHREKNLGLAKSIISGVTDIVNKYGRVIVMEDDLISSVNFLEFMNQALIAYEANKEIFSVTGYNFLPRMPAGYKEQVFLSYRPSSWGWGTWADRWNKADWEVKNFDTFMRNKKDQVRFNRGGDDLTGMLVKQMKGEIDSWGIRWCFTHFLHDAFCIVPVVSKINNIGFDESGTHCIASGRYNVPLDDCKTEIDLPDDININVDITNAVYKFHKFSFIQKFRFIIERWMAL